MFTVATERRLQLRSSVLDRIKTDFLSRFPNKLIVLHEPTKETPKSREDRDKTRSTNIYSLLYFLNIFERIIVIMISA